MWAQQPGRHARGVYGCAWIAASFAGERKEFTHAICRPVGHPRAMGPDTSTDTPRHRSSEDTS